MKQRRSWKKGSSPVGADEEMEPWTGNNGADSDHFNDPNEDVHGNDNHLVA